MFSTHGGDFLIIVGVSGVPRGGQGGQAAPPEKFSWGNFGDK